MKYLNLGGVAVLLETEAAARMAAHTSAVIMSKHYLINEEERKMQKLGTVNNGLRKVLCFL